MAILTPHLINERNAALGTGTFNGLAHTGLVAALRQRTELLEEENEELYSVLRRSETGRLEEEVKALRKLVGKLGISLKGWKRYTNRIGAQSLIFPSTRISRKG